jgi:hypothetical protein
VQVSNKSLDLVSVKKLQDGFAVLDKQGVFKALRKKYLKVNTIEE